MHPLSMRLFAMALLFAVVTPLFAATYIVPPDAEMIQRSDDIVVATGVTSTVERTARGAIVTRYYLRIEEVLKGQRSRGSHLVLTELGGKLGAHLSMLSGMPVYSPGERYLLFTETNREGEPITFGLELGQFWFEKDQQGRLLAVRNTLCGFDQNLEPFIEQVRDAAGFLDYVRGIVQQRIDPTPTYYLGRVNAVETDRHFDVIENEDLDFSGAVAAARAAWNGAGAGISYTDGGEDLTALGGFTPDNKNTVLLNDPNGEVESGVAGRGGVTDVVDDNGFELDGEVFGKTKEVDVVLNNNFSPALNTCLRSVLTHEMGHTLSIRHSNGGPTGGTCNSASAECSSSAIMQSSTNCGLNGALQTWDINAVRAVYGSGPRPFSRRTYMFLDVRWQTPSASIRRNPSPPPCTPPGISTQPQSQSITSGNSANLTVVASGSSPFTYQWYIGTTGTTSQPTGTNSSTLNVSPTATTPYWVRVTGQCAPAVDSNTATVTVNQPTCTPPSISGHPQNRTISVGQFTSLSVTASGTGPFSYQWFIGASGDQSEPINGQTTAFIQVSPPVNTSYWVRVTGQCGSPVNSNTATVTVTTSSCPDVTVQSPTATKQLDGSFVLDVIASGGAGTLTYQWFQGPAPGVGTLINTGRPVTVPAPTAPTSYWVRVSNNCGKSAESATVSIAPCDLAVIGSEPADQTIASGASATLTVGFTSASAATVRWYRGIAPDKTTEVGQGTSFNTGALTATTQFWASITNLCGEKFTRTVNITVGTCTPPAILTITTPQTRMKGETVTLFINASGTATLHYQWYEGVAGDISKPVGTDASSFTSEELTKSTKFWVKVTNDCGNASTSAMDVTVMQPRSRAVRH